MELINSINEFVPGTELPEIMLTTPQNVIYKIRAEWESGKKYATFFLNGKAIRVSEKRVEKAVSSMEDMDMLFCELIMDVE